MTASNFKPSLALTLAYEGGFVNHPADPGGATNQGITQKVYDSYRAFKGFNSARSVKQITAEEVREIYANQYWKLIRGDSIPTGLDYAVFDFAVNSGVSRAIKYLQRLVRVEDDGVIGMATLNAVYNAMRISEEAVIAEYCNNRLNFVQALNTFSIFGAGWTRRIIGRRSGVQADDTGVIDYAIKMARADDVYTMPSAIGTVRPEIPGKAVR